MNEPQNTKEVFFDEYCKTCKYESTNETEKPCNECLTVGSRINSHKPIKWKER